MLKLSTYGSVSFLGSGLVMNCLLLKSGDAYFENSIFLVAVVDCFRYLLNLGIIYAYTTFEGSIQNSK
jgi:hypothetical protein